MYLSPLSFVGMQLFHDLNKKVGTVTETFEQVFRHLLVFPFVQRMGQPGGPDIFQSLICSHIKKTGAFQISHFLGSLSWLNGDTSLNKCVSFWESKMSLGWTLWSRRVIIILPEPWNPEEALHKTHVSWPSCPHWKVPLILGVHASLWPVSFPRTRVQSIGPPRHSYVTLLNLLGLLFFYLWDSYNNYA